MRRWLVVAVAGASMLGALGAGAATTVERTLLSNLQSLGYKPQIEHVGARTQYSILTRYQGLGVPIQLSLSEGRLNIWMLVKLYPFPKGRILSPDAAQALLRLNEQLSLGGACYYGIDGNWVMLNCAFPNTSDAAAQLRSRIENVDQVVKATQKIWTVTVPAPAAAPTPTPSKVH